MIKVVFLAIAAFIVSACATTGEGAKLENNAPTALVSIACNDDIYWKGEGSSFVGFADEALKRLSRRNEDKVMLSFASDIIDKLESTIRMTFTDTWAVTLADKSTYIDSNAYANAPLSSRQQFDKLIEPTGYKLVDYRDSDFPVALAAETGVKSCMYITLTLTKDMANGVGKTGTCRANAVMRVVVKNAQGKTIKDKSYEGWSQETIKVGSGYYFQSELLSLFDEAVTDVCYVFFEDIEE